jgi:hypothetical protein
MRLEGRVRTSSIFMDTVNSLSDTRLQIVKNKTGEELGLGTFGKRGDPGCRKPS